PLDVPHIIWAIAETFTFDDLLSCISVNRAWNVAFIPVLWTDVVTFRGDEEDICAAFRSSVYRKSLIKHSRHIRALTCTFDALPALMQSRLDNLSEVNFVLADKSQRVKQSRSLTLTQELKDLSEVIALCPNLCAVSIENVRIEYDNEDMDLLAFVDFLDFYPLITCIFMQFDSYIPREERAAVKAIFERRIERVCSDRVQSLAVREGTELTRSKRGLHRWSGRERPMTDSFQSIKTPRILPDVSGGIWEHEIRGNHRFKYPFSTLAVIENGNTLEVCLPFMMEDISPKPLLSRFPALTRLSGGSVLGTQSQTLGLLAGAIPHLQELEWDLITGSEEMRAFLDDPRVNLTSFNLREVSGPEYASVLRPLIVPESLSRRHFLRFALVGLTIVSNTAFPLVQLLEVLTLCPNLQTLGTERVTFDGTEKDVDKPWICSRLRQLCVTLRQKNPAADMKEMSNVEKVARGFMKQLGTMHRLHELVFRVNDRWRCSASPFLDLSLGVTNGLEQLQGLSRLKEVTISGLVHHVGAKEMEWIAKHWPRLLMIELPVLGYIDEETGRAWLVYAEKYAVSPLSFGPVLPSVRVIVPEECYLCSCCECQPCSLD
ncbi:hypothetical protein BGZ52_000549, partial [Haplosporangium bisporale]